MFPVFATIYKDEKDQLHLYVFPGVDEEGKQLYRNIDFNNLEVEYTYTKNDDKSLDFTFKGEIHHIKCSMVNIKNGTNKVFEFDL